MFTLTCAICGKTFDAAKRSQKYCSDDCRAQVKYNRNQAWLEAHPGKAKEYNRRWYTENKAQALADKKAEYKQ